MVYKREISISFIDSTEFLKLSVTAQALFFHATVRAENNGVIIGFRAFCRALDIDKSIIYELLDNGYISYKKSDVFKIENWDNVIGRGDSARKRITWKYRSWRANVLKRDNYTCTKCDKTSNLEVHHIKRFADYKELRYDMNNGITLCEGCHKELHRKERQNVHKNR